MLSFRTSQYVTLLSAFEMARGRPVGWRQRLTKVLWRRKSGGAKAVLVCLRLEVKIYCVAVLSLLKHGERNTNAGIAQLVERNLAKVEVASSRLVSRSKFKKGKRWRFPFLQLVYTAAQWQSGHAADCKSVHPGSIPSCASNI